MNRKQRKNIRSWAYQVWNSERFDDYYWVRTFGKDKHRWHRDPVNQARMRAKMRRINGSKAMYKFWKPLIKQGFFANDFRPLKCVKCGCKKFKEKVLDMLDGHLVMEAELYCKNCGKFANSWHHGMWYR